MSYPFIGLEGMGYGDYVPATIEQMLREGKRIYEPDDTGVSYFDKEKGKFTFETWGDPADMKGKSSRVTLTKEFETFVELATYIAFWGRDFL